MPKTSVLILGLDPTLIDFSNPAYGAFPGLNADKVLSALRADEDHLRSLGFEAQSCLVDFGETAEATFLECLEQKKFDCILVGAGMRLIPENTSLFEKLINVVHQHETQAKICFNTRPDDTAEAVLRWVSSS
jgi:hypothetical protein